LEKKIFVIEGLCGVAGNQALGMDVSVAEVDCAGIFRNVDVRNNFCVGSCGDIGTSPQNQ
jgi:hypothetical protein